MTPVANSSFAPTHIRYSALLPPGYLAAFSLSSFYKLNPNRAAQQLRVEFLTHLGLPPQLFAWARQVHGARIAEAREPGMVANADGLITNRPELYLTAAVADCLPIFLWCESPNAVALLHAGWRGSAAGIAARGARMMNELFGCESHSIGVLLGPAICSTCYPVGSEVARLFSASDLKRDQDGQYFLDLRKANRGQLLEAGIASGNILMDDLCTRCHPGLLFSHRRDGSGTGRMIAVLGLTKTDLGSKRN